MAIGVRFDLRSVGAGMGHERHPQPLAHLVQRADVIAVGMGE
jgi:hypothetical protein